jgi:predicted phosphodiesterase
LLTILQLSDIHFAHSEGDTYDLDRDIEDGLLRFLPDLRQRLEADIDLIVVSGDIAFSGVADQYERAKAFLRNVRSKLENHQIPVRVIPGNHDIHRKTTRGPDQRRWRATPRGKSLKPHERQEALNALLKDAESGPGLLEALGAYNDFAASFDCAIDHTRPHWEHEFALDEGWTLRVRGMTSVLISDDYDEDDLLVLGELQALGLHAKPGEVILSLCHHPYCWLLDGQRLQPKLTHRSHLHITGHVHQHDFKDTAQHVHLRAGALHPPRSEEVASRFNVITLQIHEGCNGPELEVALLPLIWDAGQDSFMIDEENCKTCSVVVQAAPKPSAAPDGERLLALSRLTERLGALQYSDRLHCARHIGVRGGAVFAMPVGEQISAIIAHADETDQLAKLWQQVELRHGRQSSEDANPFGDVTP